MIEHQTGKQTEFQPIRIEKIKQAMSKPFGPLQQLFLTDYQSYLDALVADCDRRLERSEQPRPPPFC